MTTAPSSRFVAPKRALIWGLGGGALVAGVITIAAVAYFAKASTLRKVHKYSDPSSPEYRPPSESQVAATKLDYPAPGAQMPSAISVIYNAHKDRTRMTLELKDAAGGVGSGTITSGVSSVLIKLSSEFPGKVRPAQHGESSADGVVIIKSKAGGHGAPGNTSAASGKATVHPGSIDVDGRTVHLHSPAKGKGAYTSEPLPDHVKETMLFRVHTASLIEIAAGKSVTLTVGTLSVVLTPQQIDEIREFVARMNPSK